MITSVNGCRNYHYILRKQEKVELFCFVCYYLITFQYTGNGYKFIVQALAVLTLYITIGDAASAAEPGLTLQDVPSKNAGGEVLDTEEAHYAVLHLLGNGAIVLAATAVCEGLALSEVQLTGADVRCKTRQRIVHLQYIVCGELQRFSVAAQVVLEASTDYALADAHILAEHVIHHVVLTQKSV